MDKNNELVERKKKNINIKGKQEEWEKLAKQYQRYRGFRESNLIGILCEQFPLTII